MLQVPERQRTHRETSAKPRLCVVGGFRAFRVWLSWVHRVVYEALDRTARTSARVRPSRSGRPPVRRWGPPQVPPLVEGASDRVSFGPLRAAPGPVGLCVRAGRTQRSSQEPSHLVCSVELSISTAEVCLNSST